MRTTLAMLVPVIFATCNGDGEPANPKKACEDLGDAVVAAAERCELDADVVRTDYLASAADGDCVNVTAVCDTGALYDGCIPWLGAAPAPRAETPFTCDQFRAGDLDPSCQVPFATADRACPGHR